MIQELLSSLRLSNNQTIRQDCPRCNGKHTFSISLINGVYLYHCFRASCPLRGYKAAKITLEQIQNPIDIPKKVEYIIPDYFCNPLQNKKSLFFLKYWNLLSSYAEGLELYYDPKLVRVVFPLRDHQKNLKGATGRNIDREIVPKWYIYERIDICPYISDKGTEACVLVEDCISAVLSPISSIALLGTNIPAGMFEPYLERYKKLYIALDKDAVTKAAKLHHKLSFYHSDVELLLLDKDIKNLTKEEINNLFKRENDRTTETPIKL